MIALALEPVTIYPPVFTMSIPRENPLNFSRRWHTLWL
jgi:hypothetical protein